jgi:hypothetical protein
MEIKSGITEEVHMAHWLYQMSTDYYSHERYRTEVWEGTPVTNWTIGESKRKPTDVQLGDIVIPFFARTGAHDPGIYGWGIITFFDGEVINFRPTSPSDYLKMNSLWDKEVSDIIDEIRDGMPQGTMYEMTNGRLRELRQKIAEHNYGL